MRSAASTSCTTRSRSNTTACRCGRASRATRAAPSARWTSSTATTSSRNGRRSTRGWRPTEGAANDGDRVRTGRTIPHPVMFRVLDSEADDLTIPEIKVEHKSEYAYYPGCVDYYDVEMQFSHMNYGDTNHGIIFDSSVKLLRAVGIQPMILDRSFMKCCGHDQLWQGKVDVFERMREYNTKIIKMLGVKTFITSCAEGYRTFKLDYKLDGVRVVHITQFLYERGLRIPPQPDTAKKIRVA